MHLRQGNLGAASDSFTEALDVAVNAEIKEFVAPRWGVILHKL